MKSTDMYKEMTVPTNMRTVVSNTVFTLPFDSCTRDVCLISRRKRWANIADKNELKDVSAQRKMVYATDWYQNRYSGAGMALSI